MSFNSNSKQTFFITGASRGIGLEFTRQLAQLGQDVIATCRNPEQAIALREVVAQFPQQITLLQVDVADPASVDGAIDGLKSRSIDVLINNAGILEGRNQRLEDLDLDEVINSFQTNTIGPMRLTKSLLPLLSQSKNPKVISITSKMGSIDDNTSGGYYAYRMSKAALNMFNRSLACDHKNITCVVLHPGWVQTDMGGAGALVTVGDSVRGMTKVIAAVDISQSGNFFDFRGNSLSW